jgi:hypothetical protein
LNKLDFPTFGRPKIPIYHKKNRRYTYQTNCSSVNTEKGALTFKLALTLPNLGPSAAFFLAFLAAAGAAAGAAAAAAALSTNSAIYQVLREDETFE